MKMIFNVFDAHAMILFVDMYNRAIIVRQKILNEEPYICM